MDFSAKLCIALDSDLAEVGRAAEVIERFLWGFGVDEATVAKLNLALDELLTNTICYGFEDSAPHLLAVRLSVEGETVEAEIEDNGIAFDPFVRPVPDITLSIEDRPIGGLGIYLVREMMDEVLYKREGDHNKVFLTLRFPKVEDAAAPAD